MLSLRRPGRSPLTRAIARLLIAVLVASVLPASADASHVRPSLIPSWSASSSSVVAAEPSKLTKTAFGELLAHTGTDPQPYAFTGEPYDPNVGFQYHRARWIDPRTGRFASMDPFEGRNSDPPTLHKYLYAAADPLNKVDPNGQEYSLAALSITVGIITGLVSAGITWNRGGSAREIVQAGVITGVVAGAAVFWGVPVIEAAIVIGGVLIAYPFLLGPMLSRTVTPASIRTLENVKQVNPKDAMIFARAMQQMAADGDFTNDLVALNNALQQVASNTALQMNQLGLYEGSVVWGSLKTGVGIANVGGVTMVVQMNVQANQVVQVLGPMR